jgi:hypothetical protein
MRRALQAAKPPRACASDERGSSARSYALTQGKSSERSERSEPGERGEQGEQGEGIDLNRARAFALYAPFASSFASSTTRRRAQCPRRRAA